MQATSSMICNNRHGPHDFNSTQGVPNIDPFAEFLCIAMGYAAKDSSHLANLLMRPDRRSAKGCCEGPACKARRRALSSTGRAVSSRSGSG